MKFEKKVIIEAKNALAFDVAAGQQFKICTPKGFQAADFFAYNTKSVDEWLSPTHTWIASTFVKPRVGDIFLSRFRRPMLKMIEDGGEGVHDMLLPACDQFRYEYFGYKGPHPSCSDNLVNAMRSRGYEINVIPQPINFFTNTNVQKDGKLSAPKNIVKPNSYVILESIIDTICVVSSCPFDITPNGWEINSGGVVTEIEIEI
tara:strand:- start:122 stop:730 length:609 start_codon:yes stop_codon:yes gene_type:complete